MDQKSTRSPKLLSAQRIADTKPGARDLWLSDDHGMRGTGRLLLRITPSGTRRFHFRYTKGGVRKMIPLGAYSHTAKEGHLTLKQARELALHLATLHLAKAGSATVSLPTAHAPSLEAEKDAPTGPTLLTLCRAYADDLRRRERSSARSIAREIEHYIAPSKLAEMPARDVTPELVKTFLRELLDRGIRTTVKRIRSILHSAYEVALNAGLDPDVPSNFPVSFLTSNPIVKISSLSQYSVPRKRVLSVQELRVFWRLVDKQLAVDDTVSLRALKLAVLLGGQRCEQLVRARVEDIDLEGATILLLDPKGRRMHAREHRLPLVGSALAEVQWLAQRARDAQSALLFSSANPSVTISAGTVSLLVTAFRKTMMSDGTAAAHFQFSDLRRTAETRLAALGISKDVRAQLQSHGLGGVQARHYDRYEYMDEKRAALETWEAFLNGLLKGA